MYMQKTYSDTGIYPHIFLCNSRGPYSHIPIHINKTTYMPSIVYLDDMVLYGKGRYIVKHWPTGLMEAEKSQNLGAWVAQSVERLNSGQVIIPQFVSSSPTSFSLLSAQSSLQILCPSLSVPPPLVQSLKNK